MNNKITRRLTLYFSVVLLIFAAIVCVLFVALFTGYSKEWHVNTLTARAKTIANIFSEDTANRHGTGYGNTLRVINQMEAGDIWLVDKNADVIQMGHMHKQTMHYAELPSEAELLIKEVFRGKTVSGESFSDVIGKVTFTVGAPVFRDDTVVSAVLLHEAVSLSTAAVQNGLVILLLCMIAALLLSAGLSIWLSRHFVYPIKQMALQTDCLIAGDYTQTTTCHAADELGDLAQKINVLASRLQTAAEESAQLNQLRTDFFANISHELRTPVTVLRGSLEAICDGVVTDSSETRQFHQQMLQDTLHLERLVNDLLELTRLQNTDFVIEKNELDLVMLIADCIRAMRRLAHPKQIALVCETEPLSYSFFGDYGRLRQLLLILLDNAIKYAPNETTVAVRLKENCITVEDEGQGIPKETLPHLFDRFFSGRNYTGQAGTGLGLAIAKQIALRHGMTLSCSSEEGKGSIFSIHLPNANVDESIARE